MGMFPLFHNRTAMFWPHVLVQCFSDLFVWVAPQLAGDRPISPLFQRNHHPPLLPTTLFPQHQYCRRCLSAWSRFTSDHLWNAEVCLQQSNLLIGNVWVAVMHFCVYRIHCKVYWREGRRLGSNRLIVAQPLIGSTIRASCISSVLCCLF